MQNFKNENEWSLVYKLGAISIFMSFLTMLTEIILTALPDGARVELTINQIFDMYNRNWFMAMRYMGLMNIISNTFMLFVAFSLYGLYHKTFKTFSLFTFILSIVGYIMFMSDNVSFPMLELAQKYFKTDDLIEKNILLAAGEALFSKGASHTAGTFIGFITGEISNIMFCIIILKGNTLKKHIGIIGIISFSMLFIFEIMSSFIKSLYNEAMIFAMLGGLLTLVWYILTGIGLLKQSKSAITAI